MPTFRIDKFGGLAPRFDRRQLPMGMARVAINCRFDSGDLRPFEKTEHHSIIGHDIGNLFYYEFGDDSRFIGFGRALTVTASRTPVPDDQYRRWYYNIRPSGVHQGGLFAVSLADPTNPEPAGALGNNETYQPFNGYPVGVPAPQLAPEASATAEGLEEVGWGTDNEITSIARTNPMTVNTESEHAFERGQRVVIRIDPDLPRPGDDEGEGEGLPDPDGGETPTTGQIWALDGREGIVSDVTANQFSIMSVSATGFAEFTEDDLAAIKVERRTTDADLESRAYVFTYVTEFDEEGPPSPPSNVIDLLADGGVAQVTIRDTEHNQAVTGGDRERINRIRVYRTAAGTSDTLFLFVGTLPFAGGNSDDSDVEWVSEPDALPALEWNAELSDPVPSISLGEPLQSQQWFPPPPDLWGITMMPNGFMIGWKNNTIYASEPNLPHAWNPDYRRTLDDDVVGGESFGNTLVLGTRGRPIYVTGIDPSALTVQRMPDEAPLLYETAMADAGTGVVYVADNGLMLANRQGVRNLTHGRYSKKEWLEAVKFREKAAYHDGRVFLFSDRDSFDQSNRNPLVLDMTGKDAEPSILSLSSVGWPPEPDNLASFQWSAATRAGSQLAVVYPTPVSSLATIRYDRIGLFNESGLSISAFWVSGLITVHRPMNPSVCQILADGYPFEFRLSHIDPSTYNDPVVGQPSIDNPSLEEEVHVVTGPEPFRLKGGYVSREFAITLITPHRVQRVIVSTSMDELRAQ